MKVESGRNVRWFGGGDLAEAGIMVEPIQPKERGCIISSHR